MLVREVNLEVWRLLVIWVSDADRETGKERCYSCNIPGAPGIAGWNAMQP